MGVGKPAVFGPRVLQVQVRVGKSRPVAIPHPFPRVHGCVAGITAYRLPLPYLGEFSSISFDFYLKNIIFRSRRVD